MNATDVARFDDLHQRRERLSLPEQEEYLVLLERVVKGKDGLSEFPTEPTEVTKKMERELAALQACSEIAEGLIDVVLKAGPTIALQVAAGVTSRLGPKH